MPQTVCLLHFIESARVCGCVSAHKCTQKWLGHCYLQYIVDIIGVDAISQPSLCFSASSVLPIFVCIHLSFVVSFYNFFLLLQINGRRRKKDRLHNNLHCVPHSIPVRYVCFCFEQLRTHTHTHTRKQASKYGWLAVLFFPIACQWHPSNMVPRKSIPANLQRSSAHLPMEWTYFPKRKSTVETLLQN